VQYVIPNGFRGGIVIYPDQPDGVELKKTDGVWQIEVPKNGILRIRGRRPLLDTWCKETACFASRKKIRIPVDLREVNDEGQILMDRQGSRARNNGPLYCFSFIGTKSETKAARLEDTDTPGSIRSELVESDANIEPEAKKKE
jgi:hypothetical protein